MTLVGLTKQWRLTMKRTSYALTTLVTLLGTMFATDPGSAEEDPGIHSGPEQRVLGPSNNIDSLYATVRDSHGLHAYMSNIRTIWYDQLPNGTLTNGRAILKSGPKGSADQCGVHPVGGIYKVTATHWITFYHAERANPNEYHGECQAGPGERNHTRWSVLRLETYDRGETWHKREQVLRQDQAFMKWSKDDENARRDDAGSPRLVMHGDYLYLFYRAMNHESPDAQQMSVARALKTSLGKAGAWQKYYDGDFSEPALGGRQTKIVGLPPTARGISWNTSLKAYVSVEVSIRGIELFVSDGEDLTTWHELKRLVGPVGTVSAWGKPCVPGKTPHFPVALGYGATIGWDGSSTETGRNFWVYYMRKPEGKCFSSRYLVRRQVALEGDLLAYPTPSVRTGEPAAPHTTRFSRPAKNRTRHGWTVSTRLIRDGRPWSGHPVQVQQHRSAWRKVKRLRTNRHGYARLTGSGAGIYRFYLAPSGRYPAAHTRSFRRPAH